VSVGGAVQHVRSRCPCSGVWAEQVAVNVRCRHGAGTKRFDGARLSAAEGVLSERIPARISGSHTDVFWKNLTSRLVPVYEKEAYDFVRVRASAQRCHMFEYTGWPKKVNHKIGFIAYLRRLYSI